MKLPESAKEASTARSQLQTKAKRAAGQVRDARRHAKAHRNRAAAAREKAAELLELAEAEEAEALKHLAEADRLGEGAAKLERLAEVANKHRASLHAAEAADAEKAANKAAKAKGKAKAKN